MLEGQNGEVCVDLGRPIDTSHPAEEELRLEKLAAVVLHHMAVHTLERHLLIGQRGVKSQFAKSVAMIQEPTGTYRSTQVAEGLLLT